MGVPLSFFQVLHNSSRECNIVDSPRVMCHWLGPDFEYLLAHAGIILRVRNTDKSLLAHFKIVNLCSNFTG